MDSRLKLTWRVIRTTAKGFSDDELMTRAAALAFYSALSFAPLLVLLLWIVASLRPEWQAQLIDSLNGLVGPRASDAVRLVIENAKQRPSVGSMAGVIGLGVTLVGASAVFAQLQGALNRVWSLQPRPGSTKGAILGWLRARMHALGLLLSLAFLLVISFSASALIAVFVRGGTTGWQVLEILISLAVFVLIFGAIYKVLPDAIIEWRDAMIGATLTALLFAVGKFAIAIYLDRSNVGGPYGPAGGVVVLLVWVYYSALILLLGAELTEAVAEARGTPIKPRPYAMSTRPVPEARIDPSITSPAVSLKATEKEDPT
ncbi:YihY/virulence factor BrkB family protein [Luteibacter sp. 329MFSha]|uniref:YihY/virulence factor BrkB family protein n=1 Tax=Luteibacter sp. 329MFSha TaxID=1798239 RepID=UPI0008B0CB1D|nr:YihY/virulence factor BrkB family protein [Luteibacter sp. 329MFSha]SEW15485.1 membrane protein [Luteibacter sp. 329MFSha]